MFPPSELVASKLGTIPPTGFPKASVSETLIVIAEIPSAVTGPALLIVDAVLAGPAMKATLEETDKFGRSTWMDFNSALVDFNEQIDVPVPSVGEQEERKLFEPLTAKVGVTPVTGAAPSKTVIVMVDASELFAM